MARSMIKEKQMPNNFWGEATSTRMHTINRCPTNKLNNKKPMNFGQG